MNKFYLLFLLLLAISFSLFASCSQDTVALDDSEDELVDAADDDDEDIDLADAEEEDDTEDEEDEDDDGVEIAVAESTESKTDSTENPTTLGGAVKKLASDIFSPVTSLFSGLFSSGSDSYSK